MFDVNAIFQCGYERRMKILVIVLKMHNITLLTSDKAHSVVSNGFRIYLVEASEFIYIKLTCLPDSYT